ncbi:MAG: transposase [Pirellulaceae bacterium]|nr:transposase [Pirellulaceae bacterium]
MKILALDIGKFKSVCCLFDTKTRKFEFFTVGTDRNYLTSVFKQHPVDLVVMEACGPSGWINDLAVSLRHKTLVCSTNEEAWKWVNVKRKTDKDDALKQARMAAMNELKAVHVPSEEHREFRSLVKYRKTLDYRINKIKCTIRAWFVNHGIKIDSGEKAWHSGRTLIDSYRKPLEQCSDKELWQGELDLELTRAGRPGSPGRTSHQASGGHQQERLTHPSHPLGAWCRSTHRRDSGGLYRRSPSF